MTKEFVRPEEAAIACSVSAKTIRTWIDRRIIPAYKPTKRCILIRTTDLDKAMMRFRVGAL